MARSAVLDLKSQRVACEMRPLEKALLNLASTKKWNQNHYKIFSLMAHILKLTNIRPKSLWDMTYGGFDDVAFHQGTSRKILEWILAAFQM
jgi:hypothetical protein